MTLVNHTDAVASFLARASFTKGRRPDLDLKLRLLSLTQAKYVFLDLEGFTKLLSLSFG